MNKISIIIVNKNDRGVSDTLSTLIKIKDTIPYEIIVVDASSGELDDIRKKFPAVRWFDFIQPKDRKRTIPDQRNYGIEKSTGNIIVFIDANCIPSNGWLMKLVYPITNDGEKIVAGSYGSKDSNTIHDYDNERRSGKKYLSECPTMNAAFSREVFDKIGMFDCTIAAEDIDLCWRATDSGYRIRYVSEARITHEWGDTSEEIVRAFRYGKGRPQLYKKNPGHCKNILKNENVVLIYPIYILGLPVTILFWPYPLLILIPVIKNITHSPIKKVSYQLVYAVGLLSGLLGLYT